MPGSGRGKRLGIPTINLSVGSVPEEFLEGIYACRARLEDEWEPAVMHFGPRPVFKDTPSCEVHLLDRAVSQVPDEMTVEIVAFLRDVRDFPSVEALQEQIAEDIRQARAILSRP